MHGMRLRYQNIILAAGIGGMKPNTVLVPFFTAQSDEGDLEAGPVGTSSSAAPPADKLRRIKSRRSTRLHTDNVVKTGADIARLTSSVSHASGSRGPGTPRSTPMASTSEAKDEMMSDDGADPNSGVFVNHPACVCRPVLPAVCLAVGAGLCQCVFVPVLGACACSSEEVN